MSTADKCYASAIRSLARREHSRFELSQKLNAKGWSDQTVEQVIDQLCHQGLLSDMRFIEAVINVRRRKGYGPIYIQNYLRSKGIENELVETRLDFHDAAWQKALSRVALKKFGSEKPTDLKQKARQINFLKRRGFSLQQINDYLDRDIDEFNEYED